MTVIRCLTQWLQYTKHKGCVVLHLAFHDAQLLTLHLAGTPYQNGPTSSATYGRKNIILKIEIVLCGQFYHKGFCHSSFRRPSVHDEHHLCSWTNYTATWYLFGFYQQTLILTISFFNNLCSIAWTPQGDILIILEAPDSNFPAVSSSDELLNRSRIVQFLVWFNHVCIGRSLLPQSVGSLLCL